MRERRRTVTLVSACAHPDVIATIRTYCWGSNHEMRLIPEKDGVTDLDALRGSEDPDKDISLYINSPGGSVSAGLAIYDTMQYIRPNVSTICLGMAASMGAVLLTAGADGKRLALPNAKIMIPQPMGGMQGQASDIEIHAKEILKTREKLNEILAKHTRQPLDKIEADTDRDYYMSAEEALKYGIVDKIIEKR